MSTTEFGKKMEAKGLTWLQERTRIRVLKKNYRCRFGEIDLIFEHSLSDQELDLVFVEIRTRTTSDFASPIDTIRPSKVAKIRKVAEQFLTNYKGRASGVRFDLLCFESGDWEHIRDAM